jgi:hypothetical protein
MWKVIIRGAVTADGWFSAAEEQMVYIQGLLFLI